MRSLTTTKVLTGSASQALFCVVGQFAGAAGAVAAATTGILSGTLVAA